MFAIQSKATDDVPRPQSSNSVQSPGSHCKRARHHQLALDTFVQLSQLQKLLPGLDVMLISLCDELDVEVDHSVTEVAYTHAWAKTRASMSIYAPHTIQP
jgi:hypothetical protein